MATHVLICCSARSLVQRGGVCTVPAGPGGGLLVRVLLAGGDVLVLVRLPLLPAHHVDRAAHRQLPGLVSCVSASASRPWQHEAGSLHAGVSSVSLVTPQL